MEKDRRNKLLVLITDYSLSREHYSCQHLELQTQFSSMWGSWRGTQGLGGSCSPCFFTGTDQGDQHSTTCNAKLSLCCSLAFSKPAPVICVTDVWPSITWALKSQICWFCFLHLNQHITTSSWNTTQPERRHPPDLEMHIKEGRYRVEFISWASY